MMRNLLITLIAAATALPASSAEEGVPLLFIANQGQAPSGVRFMAKGSGVTAYFSAGEALFRLGDASVRLQFAGVNPMVQVEGLDRLPGEANFLTGPEEEWRLGVPLFDAVLYRELYPGIDMVYGGHGQSLKSQFIVAPGADPWRIRMRYLGAGEVRIDENGGLVIPVEGRELREQAPSIYQDRKGRRVAVDGQFTLAGDGTVGFLIGDYDIDQPLIIDPVLSYSTLLGGSNSDAAMALAVDGSGAAYVAGFTASYDFPTSNPEQNVSGGGNDIFVAKLNASGSGVVYCTYLGGRSDDRAYGIAVDGSGAAYITGSTTSTNFPVRGAIQTKLAGSRNAFVAKVSPAGNSLVYSTYLGGSGSDAGNGIAVDGSGNAFVAGDTTSLNFPANGFQKNNHGSQDAFVAKLSADGSRLLYSTFLGGVNDDHGAAIAVDSGGSAYVTGSTYSPNFPLAAASQGVLAGGQDAFVSRFSADGNTLLFSTFLGGSGGSLGYPESGQGIAVDGLGNAYVTGTTSSVNFPLLNPLQSSLHGGSDAFVTKLTASGVLTYSTYLGGGGMETGNAIAVDAGGNAYVAGQTFSSDLPVANAFQAVYGGDYDAFVAKISATDSLASLSYLGGGGSDTATAVALDSAANIYIAGWTLSANFPVLNGYQSTNAGNYGAFIVKVLSGAAADPPATVGVTPNSGNGSSQTFSLQFSDSAGAADLTTVSALFNASSTVVNGCSVTYSRAGNTLALLTDAGAAPGGTITPGSGSQQNSQCVLNGAGSSVSTAGNILTLNLAITFQAAFAGSRNIYLQAVNPAGSTGWQLGGSWTVTAGPPAAVSVTPNAGSASSQTFSFLFSDPKGYAAITMVRMLVNNVLAGAGSCYLIYYPASHLIYLADDTGGAFPAPVLLGQSGTLQNSQCIVNAATSSSSGSGNNLTLNLSLSFQAAFTGLKNIYMDAYDGTSAGWQQEGSWTPASVILGPVSVTPSSGTGSSQTFGFVSSDPKGYAALTMVRMLINNVLSGTGACYLLYYPGSHLIYLADDTGGAFPAPIVLGQSGTLQNSQCIVNAAASSSSGSGNNLTLNLSLSFQAAFTGLKNIYMDVYDVTSAGWQQKGSWTPASVTLGPVSVTPNSGTGSSQTFSFVSSDPKGYTALTMVRMLINNVLSGTGACYLLYYPGSHLIYLADDTGGAFPAPVLLGQSGTLQNSQCIVNAAASSSSGSGNNLTLNLSLSFQAAFTGLKNIYMDVYDVTSAGWQQKGSWTGH